MFGRIHQCKQLGLALSLKKIINYLFNLFNNYKAIQIIYFSFCEFFGVCVFHRIGVFYLSYLISGPRVTHNIPLLSY